MKLPCWPSQAIFIVTILVSLSTGQDSDGPSPYGAEFAPDVVSIDVPWNNDFPAYEGLTLPNLDDIDVNTTDPSADLYDASSVSSLSGRSAQDFFLRIMPLGASITEGVRSSDGNGYRRALRDQLRFKGWNVNMVGSKQNGKMADRVSLLCRALHPKLLRLTTTLCARTMKVIPAGSSLRFTAPGRNLRG